MKLKTFLTVSIVATAAVLAGCSSTRTADNYNSTMNAPDAKSGTSESMSSQLANKRAWNAIEVTQMTSVRRLADGNYAPDNNSGVLTVRAVLVNSGDTPTQGNWRCNFFDSNNLPLYEDASNEIATSATGLGWHRMIVYPVNSRSQTVDANVVNCKAADNLATNYRVEFHDTSNDITIYKR
jgi:hypothetical protein